MLELNLNKKMIMKNYRSIVGINSSETKRQMLSDINLA